MLKEHDSGPHKNIKNEENRMKKATNIISEMLNILQYFNELSWYDKIKFKTNLLKNALEYHLNLSETIQLLQEFLKQNNVQTNKIK